MGGFVGGEKGEAIGEREMSLSLPIQSLLYGKTS